MNNLYKRFSILSYAVFIKKTTYDAVVWNKLKKDITYKSLHVKLF